MTSPSLTPEPEFDDDPSIDDEDDMLENCGMWPDGTCSLAGTEWCDWDCPLGAAATLRRKK
jgi:hypothetical protein